MSSEPHDRVYGDLVAGLLDARPDPATERFDAELEHAVERGDLTAHTARMLRFWQRASLRALVDHTRAVLPTVLGALEASRRAAEADLASTIAALSAVPDEPEPGTVVDLRDTPGPASTPGASGPSSLGERRRLIVAGLTTVLPVIRPQHD